MFHKIMPFLLEGWLLLDIGWFVLFHYIVKMVKSQRLPKSRNIFDRSLWTIIRLFKTNTFLINRNVNLTTYMLQLLYCWEVLTKTRSLVTKKKNGQKLREVHHFKIRKEGLLFCHIWLYIHCPVKRKTSRFVQPKKFILPEGWHHETWRLKGAIKICLQSTWRF